MSEAYLAFMNFSPKALLHYIFTALLLLMSTQIDAVYILRYTTIGEHGAMTFTGNTLGLSKEPGENLAGTADAIGAYITTDTNLQVGDFPAGTTLDYTLNNSAAVLSLPIGSTVLYAELIWSGSYGYVSPTQGEDPNIVLIPANGPINFTTPDSVVHQIISDPATRQNMENADMSIPYDAGNYTRSQNVTSLVQAAGAGTYSVGGVPSTISPTDDTHNAAGWTLAVVYSNPTLPINNMSLFVANQQGLAPGNPAEVQGFCTPPVGELSGRLLVSAIEGDANKTGEMMAFGPSPMTLTNLSGPNNLVNSFFGSQINDDDGMLDTSGTFGNRNQDASMGINISAGRQGYDITNVDVSPTLMHSQSMAFAQGITTPGQEDFYINALGIQIEVTAPVINPVKKVNGQDSINASVGDIVTFTVTMTNTGDIEANDVEFQDILEAGLVLVPNTFKVDNVVVLDPDLVNGVPLGNLAVNDSFLIEFQVEIIGYPISGNIFFNTSNVKFTFSPCVEPMTNMVNSNIVSIVLPPIDSPRDFEGRLKKCLFLNETRFCMKASWLPPTTGGVIAYRIYKKGMLVDTIPASGPLVIEMCFNSKNAANDLTIVAVYINGQTSNPTELVLVQ